MPHAVRIAAIVAMSENRVIGINNQLPWHLPADLRHFKELTTGHAILMGRKTYESIGRPLPNRLNIVMTRNRDYQAPGCCVVGTLDEAIHKTKEEGKSTLFIIGGAEIYSLLLPFVTELYLTIVHHTLDGDAVFPVLTTTDWVETERIDHPADEKNMFAYSFLTLIRS